MKEIKALLMRKEKVGIIIKTAYQIQKHNSPSFSLQYICTKSSIPSKGYLSDVMSLKRKLKTEYAKKLAKTLNFDSQQSRIFVCLSELEKSKGRIEKVALERKLALAIKNMEIQKAHYTASTDGIEPTLLSKIYCSLGLVSLPATLKEISYAAREPIGLTEITLNILLKEGFIKQDKSKKYDLCAQQVQFDKGQNKVFFKSYLNKSLKEVDYWFEKKDMSFFDACSISVSTKKYQKLLEEIRQVFNDFASDLETTKDADQIVHLSLQAYPEFKDK